MVVIENKPGAPDAYSRDRDPQPGIFRSLDMKKLLGCIAVLGLTACAQPSPLGPPIVRSYGPGLSMVAIRDVVAGNTGTGTMSGSHIIYSMYLATDGTAQAELPTGIDKGNWRLTDDGQWWAKWQLFRGGTEYCQRVYLDGDVYKFVNNDSEELLRFAPGKRI